MKREYSIKESINKEDLINFGFVTYDYKRFTYFCYLFKKIIRAKYTVNLEEMEMTWEVYDTTNQKPYNAFYSNINGKYNQVAIACFERFNEIIEKMAKAGIIEGEE